jgi:hypothetical protein
MPPPSLIQMDSPYFTWRTKNFLWDELNIGKWTSFGKNKNTDDQHRYLLPLTRAEDPDEPENRIETAS